MANTKATEVITIEEVDITTPKRKTKKVTRKGILDQVRCMKRANGTENEWGPEARSRLAAKAASIGITLK
tara:strand:- start:198 stop:407 length:210 start_codon:yes stop_codon:yes gene_type:complete